MDVCGEATSTANHGAYLNPGTELSVRNKDVRCIVEGRNQSLVSSMTQAIEESKLMCLVSF